MKEMNLKKFKMADPRWRPPKWPFYLLDEIYCIISCLPKINSENVLYVDALYTQQKCFYSLRYSIQ